MNLIVPMIDLKLLILNLSKWMSCNYLQVAIVELNVYSQKIVVKNFGCRHNIFFVNMISFNKHKGFTYDVEKYIKY